MAYTDLEFYKNKYCGNVVPDSEFDRLAERASDFIDLATFDRLVNGLPNDEKANKKVQKSVCIVAERMYEIELAEKQAIAAAKGNGSIIAENVGVVSNMITSCSAGAESVSYALPSQMASGAKAWSAVYEAAGDGNKTNKVLYDAVKLYLTGVKDNHGVPLLYAGF